MLDFASSAHEMIARDANSVCASSMQPRHGTLRQTFKHQTQFEISTEALVLQETRTELANISHDQRLLSTLIEESYYPQTPPACSVGE